MALAISLAAKAKNTLSSFLAPRSILLTSSAHLSLSSSLTSVRACSITSTETVAKNSFGFAPPTFKASMATLSALSLSVMPPPRYTPPRSKETQPCRLGQVMRLRSSCSLFSAHNERAVKITIITKAIRRLIQKGLNTHNHDQWMTPISFKTIKVKSKKLAKPIPELPPLVSLISPSLPEVFLRISVDAHLPVLDL